MSRLLRSANKFGRAALAAAIIGGTLAGCSEHAAELQNSIYLDRRETVGVLAGDAIAANRASQMIDPWSPPSANRNIAFNGEKMQTAVERYRTNKVIPPVNATTSSLQYSQAQQAAQSATNQNSSSSSSGSSVK